MEKPLIRHKYFSSICAMIFLRFFQRNPFYLNNSAVAVEQRRPFLLNSNRHQSPIVSACYSPLVLSGSLVGEFAVAQAYEWRDDRQD